uniref:Three prime repair exonuclease 1 n=1 Tax=Lygus hesperus TaxID=30085 RepID=A0A0A9WDF4_LYGHE
MFTWTLRKNLRKDATEITGMSLDPNNRLLKDGQELDTVGRKEGFDLFFKFLLDLCISTGKSKLVLVSHGATFFDMPLLRANLLRLDLAMWQQFNGLVFRFCDTFRFAKAAKYRLGLTSLSLRNIAKSLGLCHEGGHHGALSDALLTKRVSKAMGMNDMNMIHSLIKWDNIAFRDDIRIRLV